MSYARAYTIIWGPDEYQLEEVAEAALVVLSTCGAASADAHQASYLITTLRPR